MPASLVLNAVINQIVVAPWTYVDADLTPLTGQTAPANVTLTLMRQSGSTMILAAEAVTWTEIGATGHYYLTFTPLNTGLYRIRVQQLAGALIQESIDVSVFTSGATFAANFTNAYCSESDVERWFGLDVDASSTPTVSQVAAFAEGRASELTTFAALNGFTVTPATVTADSEEEDILRELNAIAAAADSLVSKFIQTQPLRTEKAEILIENEYKPRLEAFGKWLISVKMPGGVVRSHIQSGEVTEFSEAQITDAGIEARGETMETEH